MTSKISILVVIQIIAVAILWTKHNFPEWQKYDIYFEAPVFREDGKLLKPAYITVLHNGVFIHNHVEVKGVTIFTGLPKYKKHPSELPLYIQGSGHHLAFRNIWIREL